MKKRLLCLFLVLMMLLSAVPVATAAPPSFKNFTTVNIYQEGQFTDVPSSSWYASNVRLAYELGLIKGVSNTQFDPTGNITVAETLALACRLHSIYHGNGSEFQQETPWYQVYVDYAKENGILTGLFTEFDSMLLKNYTGLATRELFAALFAQALPSQALPAINTIGQGEIPDVSPSTAIGADIYMLYKAGILTGSDEFGTFHPNNNISRAEVATIVVRMADRSMRVKFAPKEKPVLPTDKELAVLPSFVSSMTKCKTAVDELHAFWENDIAYNSPASDAKCEQAVADLAEVKAMLDNMVDKYAGYGYYATLVKRLQSQSEKIDYYYAHQLNTSLISPALKNPVCIITGLVLVSQTKDLMIDGLDFLNIITIFS